MEALMEVVWVGLVFLTGLAVGSFLNVVVGRLPLEKSILWPNSRCLTCLRPLYLQDNLPVIGWLLRRGRCRFCGTPFSSRYMWIELFTGVVFAALFYFEVLHNWHGLKYFEDVKYRLYAGVTPWQGWVFWLHHATLFAFLLAASLCDWDHRTIPLPLTVTGTLIGLVGATLWAWPFPNDPAVALALPTEEKFLQGYVRTPSWAFMTESVPRGLYPWPVWGPLPEWWLNHSWALGLVTGLVGAAVGMAMIRVVKFLFEKGLGKEAMGLGDADLMMMAGAFVGWQVTVVSFFAGAMVSLVAVIVSLPFGGKRALREGGRIIPFGPGLAIGTMLTLLAWPRIGPDLQKILFDETLVLVVVVVVVGGMFFASLILRATGFGGEPERK
jgi:leader peptidase (prepilin peptidase) / N-methyltransferase